MENSKFEKSVNERYSVQIDWYAKRAIYDQKTSETLRKEIHFCNSGVGEYKDIDDREALFVEREEALISRENTMWLTTQRPKSEKGN